ncbi:hypothetical protein ACFQZ4_48575 [Catellatospora coxensis]|uniref:Uncharacterized protein n=1 Tax=Catellatospora coxensis TaxID=310354 RepID=A0A8J3KS06_9ACTN|nr:hypothetical protein [Catellatospora coxensis]GIG03944.1 hypothetical protein Cco03nite_06440 [Catellatospora coxensis]
MPIDRPTLPRVPTWAAVTALVLAALLGCCPPARPWTWFGEDRQYPHADGFFHISRGDDDLEEDLLPIYGVELPCGVADVRYGNLQEPINELYVRFVASMACLDAFRADYGLSPVDWEDPSAPDMYGWHISTSAKMYSGDYDDNHLYLYVEDTQTPPVAYLVLQRWGPPKDSVGR